MKYIFDRTGIQTLEAYCISNVLFAFDYDGTLAKIVMDPQHAVMDKTTSRLLRELIKIAPVSVISG